MKKIVYFLTGFALSVFMFYIVVMVTAQESKSDNEKKKKKKENAAKAVEWAKQQIGKYVQPYATKNCKYAETNPGKNACSSPTFKPDPDDIKKGNIVDGHAVWYFYCLRFVRTAYGANPKQNTAAELYAYLQKAIHKDSSPPAGALVFWKWSTPGHVGISDGAGQIIHTGVNPATKTNGIRSSPLNDITDVLDEYNKFKGADKGKSYLGWAYAPDDWPGRK